MPRNKKQGRSLKKFRNRAEKKARRFREEAKQLDAAGKKRPVDYVINKDVVYDRPDEDFNSLLARYDYQLGFPGAVNEESAAIHQRGVEEDASRLDLRGDFVITIDGETAKDFDDAISLEFRDGIYHLGVHIADVSHYVAQDSKLDKVAARRGTSVYLIDHVIPMLPEVLSNDLCSLVEGKPRLTFSCLMDIDESGRCLRYTFKKSVIQSRRRTTYTEIQKILDGKLDLGEEFRKKTILFNQLKQILFRKRIREGAINLESDELFFEPAKGGRIERIFPKPRLESERIIEEFMLMANISAATFLDEAGAGIYRIHESPEEEKLLRFRHLVGLRGHKLPNRFANPLQQKGKNPLNDFIEGIPDLAERKLFSFLLLTSFKQARYSEENVGHYGLAFPFYTHFTSPIRRYPDLLVHRLIHSVLKREGVKRGKGIYSIDELGRMATQSSGLERKAVAAEREYHKIKSIRYLSERIGHAFDTLVIGLIPRGLFVRDSETGVEGFVDGFFLERYAEESLRFDEKDIVFRTRSGHVAFAIGLKLKVELVSVNPERLFVDFRPVKETFVRKET